jgi:tol-pal system protein YbgF
MKKSLLLLIGVSFFVSFDAKALFDNNVQRQIDQIKEDLKVLQRKQAREGDENNDVVQISQMDETLRHVVGRMDMIEHQLKTLEDKINMINKDIDVRLKMIEGKPIEGGGMSNQQPAKKFDAPIADGAPKSLVGDVVSKGDRLPDVKTKSAEEIYQEGLDAINAGKSEDATDRFTSFLTKFPNHNLAANAQYWLGESYYVKKDYAKAAVAFAKGYEKYKDGNKGADNILKLGIAMQMLGKKNEACTAFVNMEKEFPKAPQNLKVRAKKKAEELACPK